MPARPVPLRQTELTAYAKAMTKAGVAEWRVEVDPATGRHAIIVGKGEKPKPANDWADLE